MSNLESNGSATAKAEHHSLVIKNNNCATNDPCAICGARTDPGIGPELFLEGTWALVCYGCGWEHAPGLVEAIQTMRGDHLCGWRNHGKEGKQAYVDIGRHVFHICKNCNKYWYWAIRMDSRSCSDVALLTAFAGMKAGSLEHERRLVAAIQDPNAELETAQDD